MIHLNLVGHHNSPTPLKQTPRADAPAPAEPCDTVAVSASTEAPKVAPKRSVWAALKAQAHHLTSRVALSMGGTAGAVAPELTLTHMLSSQFLTPALGAATRLGLMDALPAKADDLAASLKLNPDGVNRLMRACAAAGAVKLGKDGTFSRTRMGDYLTADHPKTLAPLAVMLTDPAHWESWGQLEHSIRTGNPASQKALGVDNVFDHYGANPAEAERFNAGMTAISRSVASDIGKYYDLSEARRIIDVGGGHGYILSSALKSAPNARGTLYDLAPVVNGADDDLEKFGEKSRVDKVAGSFFDSVPAGGDVYLMKTVLHDWTDAQCVQILRNVRNAMSDSSRLLIIESVVTEKPSAADFMNLHMMVMAGGKERTRDEFETLLAHGGLKLEKVTATAGPFHIIEASVATT